MAKIQDMERAQAAFHKKEVAKREGQVAMAEYQAGLIAERSKTEKLRALRLAKEAADAANPPVVAEPAPKGKAKAAAKPAAAKAKKKRA